MESVSQAWYSWVGQLGNRPGHGGGHRAGGEGPGGEVGCLDNPLQGGLGRQVLLGQRQRGGEAKLQHLLAGLDRWTGYG